MSSKRRTWTPEDTPSATPYKLTWVTRVIKTAVKTYGAPEIINSDQGSQFTSNTYIVPD